MTPLDEAHERMAHAPEDEAARRGYYDRLVRTELLVLLASEAEGPDVAPRIFALDGGDYVVAFDTAARLAEFAGGPAEYAGLSGGRLAEILAGRDLGLALNLGVAPSASLLPADAVDWLAETRIVETEAGERHPVRLLPPRHLSDGLLGGLEDRLKQVGPLARRAYLVGAEYQDGGRGTLLAFVDAAAGAEPVLTRVVAEAVAIMGASGDDLDVVFRGADDPAVASMERVGLRLDLPEAEPTDRAQTAPGMDRARPPRLR